MRTFCKDHEMDHKLTIEFSRVTDGYHLKARSQMGEAEASLALPFSEAEALLGQRGK